MALNPKQQRFIAEYLVDLNASQAAIRAGYSQRTAGAIAHKLLKKAEIAQAVQAQAKAHIERVDEHADVTLAQLLAQYHAVTSSDIGDLVDERGHLRPIHELPRHVRLAIASVKVTKHNLIAGDGVMDDVVEVKFWNKTNAMQDMAKRFGLLVERVEVKIDDPVTTRMNAARARVATLAGKRKARRG